MKIQLAWGDVFWQTTLLFKTVDIEIGLSENGGNLRWTKNHSDFFSGQKSIMPIVEIVLPVDEYLFHCSVQKNAVGDKSTFAYLPTSSPKLVFLST